MQVIKFLTLIVQCLVRATRKWVWAGVSIVSLMLTLSAPAQTEIRVDAASTATTPDGATWANSYKYLQDAIAQAALEDPPVEIWVANGTYYPDEGSNLPSVGSVREHTFRMSNNVAILGGFAGIGTNEDNKNQRNPATNITILSGDIQQNDPGTITDNSFHVVTGERVGETAVIDGFTITAGNADDTAPAPSCSTIECPPETTCGYDISDVGGKVGGGMLLLGVPVAGHDCAVCQPLVMRCRFEGNRAHLKGGGVFFAGNPTSRPVFGDCEFIDNVAGTAGGGFCDDTRNTGLSEATVINSLFEGNTAAEGAAVFMRQTNGLTLINCTIVDNTATSGGSAAVTNSEACPTSPGSRQDCLHLENCIVYDNTASRQTAGFRRMNNCIVEDYNPSDVSTFCVASLTNASDPQFVGSGDYRLSSTSPAIDSGLMTPIVNTGDPGDTDQDGDFDDPMPDLDGLARISSPAACIVDRGAYEFQAAIICHGDIDGDCDVDVDDLIAVILQWGTCITPCSADVFPSRCNPDGEVNVDDLILIILNWGTCTGCTPTGTGLGADPESYEDCENICEELEGDAWIRCMQGCFQELCNKGHTEFCD
jgi:hypothetical protein